VRAPPYVYERVEARSPYWPDEDTGDAIRKMMEGD